MTDRTLQQFEMLWTQYHVVDPTDDDTDWLTNLQVARAEGGFVVTVVDNVHKDVAVHRMSQDQMMSLVRWLQDGPDADR